MALLHVFIGIAILWHRRVNSNPSAEMKMLDGVLSSNMRLLYVVSGLLMLRTGARFGEYYLGRVSNPLLVSSIVANEITGFFPPDQRVAVLSVRYASGYGCGGDRSEVAWGGFEEL